MGRVSKILGYAPGDGEFSSYRRDESGPMDEKGRCGSNGAFGLVSMERSIA